MQESRESDALIAIVDDDPSVRGGLQSLVRSVGWKAETFASAQEFLARRGLRRQVVWCWTCNCLV